MTGSGHRLLLATSKLNFTRMELLRILVIFLSLLDIYSVKNKPKCIQNFLKGQTALADIEDREPAEEFDVVDVLGGLEGPSSERVYLQDIPSKYKECQYFAPGTFNPNPSILIDFNNGRLGNQMSSLASTICLAAELGLRAMMTDRTFSFLAEYFTKLTSRAEVLESRLCSPSTDLQFTALAARRGTSGQVLVMPAYPNTIDLYPKYLDTLKETFNFKEEYQRQAANFLNNLKRKVNFRNSTFVSLHVRRTDHKYTFNGGGDRALNSSYYQNAINLARSLYGEVFFIVVSDDLQWCKENLKDESLHYTDNEDTVRGTGMDLAVLTLCHHSVLSHGTFSLWGAILAGGDVIAPSNYQLPQLGRDRKIYFV